MTTERDPDPDETAKIPVPTPEDAEEGEEFDPDQTLVREDWESVVIRRVAPRVAAVQSEIGSESGADEPFGWESEALRRLCRGLQAGKNG